MDHVLGRMSGNSGRVMSFVKARITDLKLADDAVIIAETSKVLSVALESLNEEAETLRLRVSCIRTKVQAFGDILNATSR